MSRIAGLVGPADAAERAAHLATMLARPRVDGAQSLSSGDAAFGGTPGSLARVGGITIALDGRIYNRDELHAEGADAEAVARLWRRLGPVECLQALNGDFGLAVHDEAARTLWLARDRMGLRPLYYARTPDLIAFASRPGALLSVPRVRATPDPEWVARFAGSHYRVIDNDPSRSPYLDVDQVPAGTVLRFTDGAVHGERYWTLAGDELTDASAEELAERYRDLLLDAVRRRVSVVDRPAFTLSGGMDSSSVIACAVRSTGTRQHAFSTVYEDATYDERGEIASMLDTAVEQWHQVAIGTPNVFDIVARMVEMNDEPVATATWLSHLLLVEAAHGEGFTALFGGLGGDELNAGEYEYFPLHFADLRAAGRDDDLRREIDAWARLHDHPVFRKGRAEAEAAMARVSDPDHPGLCRTDRLRLLRYAEALLPEYRERLNTFEPVMEHPLASCLANRAWQDLTRETLPCCLRAGDRHTAAYGMERIEPFLDHRLAELMFFVPGDLKIREGVTKRLLREAMRGILPEETRTRVAKTGWNAPAHVWFSGAGKDAVLDLVRSQAFRERGIYDPVVVERLVEENDAIVASGEPRENHMMFLWQLVNLEIWLQGVDRR